MKTDPLRVAGWSVVAMGALVFAGAAWRIAHSEPSAPPPLPAPAPAAAFAAPVAAPVTTTTVAPPRSPQPVETHYIGNTNTHKFHRASCRYAGCKNCTARFATREEATQAGYRPGRCCDP